MRLGRGVVDDKDVPAFEIMSKTEGYCGMCNVPGYVMLHKGGQKMDSDFSVNGKLTFLPLLCTHRAQGDGLSGCQVEEDCGNLVLPNMQKLTDG